MKKLLLILLCLPLLFSTCKKEEIEEVLPCLCENSTNSILIPRVNIEEYKDNNDNRNFADLRNDLEKVEEIESYQVSSIPFLISGKSAFISGNNTICDNDPVPAEVLVSFSESTPPFTFSYSINGSNQPQISTFNNPYVITTKDAGYYSLVSFSDINGPGDINGQAIVTVLNAPIADFLTQSDTLSILYPSIQLTDVSIGNITDWSWNFGDGSTSLDQNPYHTYSITTGLYALSLIVTDDNGCSDTISKIITITDDYWIWVPNAFTPNNDGRNDKFCIAYNGIRENTFIFNVFDRFSNLVYSTNNINDLDFENGWNGTHHETGNNLSNGVYTYEVYYQEFEGWKHQENGKISLIRDISKLSNDFDCYPQGVSNCAFGDMIDHQQGFIYTTQEDIVNW